MAHNHCGGIAVSPPVLCGHCRLPATIMTRCRNPKTAKNEYHGHCKTCGRLVKAEREIQS